jgi:Domain of Unknown Function (DUF1259)
MNFKQQRNVLMGCLIGAVLAVSLLLNLIWHSPVVVAQQPSNLPPLSSEWKNVEQAIGKTGTLQPGDVFKLSFPRRDLQIVARGVKIKPTFALGSWAAFKKMGDETMVMGDLVLTSDEITPVMTKLQQGGIEQTALHNHIPDPFPSILYLHIQGQGNSVKLATAIREAIALTKTPFATPPKSPDSSLGIDTNQIDKILGAKGKVNGGIYQLGVPRLEKIIQAGMEIPPSMGTATAINFQPTGNGKAAITGDFVLIANEVNPVIRTLRQNGIEITALHSHMLDESPRTTYLHFWANDDAIKLARGLRAAIDKTHFKHS